MFHSAGREDVDVRMLGEGRPFVLEFIDAKKAVFTSDDYAAMEQEVNQATSSVAINSVKFCDKVETRKEDIYICVVMSRREDFLDFHFPYLLLVPCRRSSSS